MTLRTTDPVEPDELEVDPLELDDDDPSVPVEPPSPLARAAVR
jgi:hypothetical protein